ncbi:3D domain-containing protein [Sporosarcina sp. NPDC096371]|uniref:3D domain-containing protein n=1 Tax=Sporosarcina sp. NPDC096371 TaxID=3364530 RepID=UPI00381E3652
MLKLKIFLLAILFVGSTYLGVQGSVLANTVVQDEEFTILDYLSDIISSKESDELVEVPQSSKELEPEPIVYKVTEGDNLYRIARNHDISLDSLLAWNGLTGELIHPGDELIVSGDGELVETAAPAKEKIAVSPSPPPTVSNEKELLVTATAYTAYCEGCSGTTAYGIDLRANPNHKVIAVDPNLIPLGTKVWVEGYGEAIAADTGGAIKGHKIDVFIPSYDGAMEWGVRKVKMKVLN